MTTKTQLAHYCADHFPSHIHTGITLTHTLIASTLTLLAGFGIGWYIKGRGWFGVKVDANNAVTKVEATVATL